MTSWQLTRIIAGSFILLSLWLAINFNQNWLWFTAFVGANLLQSGFTRWCLMEKIMHQRVKQPGV